MRSKPFIKYAFPFVVLTVLYFVGPQPQQPSFNTVMPLVPDEMAALQDHIINTESRHNVKPGNEAEIIWYDTMHTKTAYAVLYLHGFSASKAEGDPVHKQFAKTFGCNLFLARLADHGIDTTEALMLFTADRGWESAKEALAITRKLGEKVIIIGTSTGSTLALKLAADYPEDVFALINLSPNIELQNSASFLLNNPWGLYIARMVMGGKYKITDATEEHAKYWNNKYRLESLTELQELLEETMTEELFQQVKQPSLTLYYYKDEAHQDPQVKVSAMLNMHNQIATPPHLKAAIAMPETGEHVIGSSLVSKDVDGVSMEMRKFAMEKLGMVPVK